MSHTRRSDQEQENSSTKLPSEILLEVEYFKTDIHMDGGSLVRLLQLFSYRVLSSLGDKIRYF